MIDMSVAEITAKVRKALETDRTIDEVAQYAGTDRSTALAVMLQLAGSRQIEMTDCHYKKWALRSGWGEKEARA